MCIGNQEQTMNVSDLSQRDIVTVPASASVREAAVAMREHHVGALAITDPYESGRIIGLVTDRDLVLDLLATGRPAEGEAIGGFCRTELAGVPGTASIGDAVRAMQRSGVRRLLVTGPGNAITGLVSVDDLLDAVAGEIDALADTLRAGAARESARGPRPRPAGDPPRNLYITRNEP
jgi:CBS domain-containing protein